MQALLELHDFCMSFGGLQAVDRVSLSVMPNEIVSLIGPNGAGKTTLFNCVTGFYQPTSGNVSVNVPINNRRKIAGKNILLNGKTPDKISSIGLARTFQNIRLFQNMNVLENVLIGQHRRMKQGLPAAIIRSSSFIAEEKQSVDNALKYLRFMGLEPRLNDLAKNLSYGDQRRLEIARALATEPFILLLDEPAAGMNPQETVALDNDIRRLKEIESMAVFLIEHDMNLVMSLSERIYVMDYGKLIAHGNPEEIRRNPDVIEAYLGEVNDA